MMKKLFIFLVLGMVLLGCTTRPAGGGPNAPVNQTPQPAVNETMGEPEAPANETAEQPPAAEEKWEDMQMKFTYVGSQEKIVPSVGISVNEFDLGKFGSGTEGFDYGNDEFAMKTFRITDEEMRESVNAVFVLEFMNEENSPEDPSVSFMFYNGTSGSVREVILDYEEAGTVAEAIRDSLTVSAANATPLEIYG